MPSYRCPLCGWAGFASFNGFDCENRECKNFKKDATPPREDTEVTREQRWKDEVWDRLEDAWNRISR